VPGPENELFGFQANPNEFGKCSNCGKLLQSKKEQEVKLCSECQKQNKQEQLDTHKGE
jgi:predicted amidophosphoribosyltransferase